MVASIALAGFVLLCDKIGHTSHHFFSFSCEGINDGVVGFFLAATGPLFCFLIWNAWVTEGGRDQFLAWKEGQKILMEKERAEDIALEEGLRKCKNA